MNKTSAATAEAIYVAWHSGNAANQKELGAKHGVARSSTNAICSGSGSWKFLAAKYPDLKRPAPVKSPDSKPRGKPAAKVVESTDIVDGEELSINIAADLLEKLPRANLKAILLLSKYATGEAQDLLTMLEDSDRPCVRTSLPSGLYNNENIRMTMCDQRPATSLSLGADFRSHIGIPRGF